MEETKDGGSQAQYIHRHVRYQVEKNLEIDGKDLCSSTHIVPSRSIENGQNGLPIVDRQSVSIQDQGLGLWETINGTDQRRQVCPKADIESAQCIQQPRLRTTMCSLQPSRTYQTHLVSLQYLRGTHHRHFKKPILQKPVGNSSNVPRDLHLRFQEWEMFHPWIRCLFL